MCPRVPSSDAAETSMLGAVSAFVLIFAGMVGAFAWSSSGSADTQADTKILGVNGAGPIDAGQKSFVVAATGRPMFWTGLGFELDGMPLAYAGTPDEDNEFCVARGGDTCLPRLPSGIVGPGDRIVVYHHDLDGRTFEVLDMAAANQPVLSLTVH